MRKYTLFHHEARWYTVYIRRAVRRRPPAPFALPRSTVSLLSERRKARRKRPAARPPVISVSYPPARRLMLTRGRVFYRYAMRSATAIATRPRRRTVFAAGELLRTLAERRTIRRRILTLGLRRVAPAVWYDDTADVRYGVASWAPAVAADRWGAL